MAKKQLEPTLTINGKEYKAADLSDQQKALVNHVLNLEQKIANQVFQLEQLQGGKTFFMAQLESAMKIAEGGQ